MPNTVLVTGASGGIGQELVHSLADRGWNVIGTDHPKNDPSTAIHKLCHAWFSVDLMELVDNPVVLNQFAFDIKNCLEDDACFSIVHNAAIQLLGSYSKLTKADWNTSISVNLMAPILINQILLPQLSKNSGSIVHVGSIHSSLTKPSFAAYATCKSALAGLTRAMAVDVGSMVRVNAIEPAAIGTDMLVEGFADNPALLDQLKTYHPTGNIGCPSDVASAILFLLDPKNSFLNGCILSLGGGIHGRLHDPV